MKKLFEIPELEIELFAEDEDVIRCSGLPGFDIDDEDGDVNDGAASGGGDSGGDGQDGDMEPDA